MGQGLGSSTHLPQTVSYKMQSVKIDCTGLRGTLEPIGYYGAAMSEEQSDWRMMLAPSLSICWKIDREW
jgi:hypothetical protein